MAEGGEPGLIMNLTIRKDELKLWVFTALILVGPALSIGLLKAHLVAVFFVILILIATSLKYMKADKGMLTSCALLLSCCFIWFAVHALNGAINARYFMYLFYTVFCFMVFIASYHALSKLNNHTLTNFLFVFCSLNLLIGFVEMIVGLSFFGLNPVGDRFQIGSSFWANVNTNAYAVLIFSCAIYVLGGFKKYLFITLLLIVYCLFIHAKLVLALTAMQFVFFAMYSNPRYRIYGLLFLAIVSPVFVYLFYNNFLAIFLAAEYAVELISNDNSLKELVESGRLSSIAIRAYTLSEMTTILQNFDVWKFLFGAGFGSINISFMNNTLGVYETYYSPHFFYLEIFIFSGLLFYVMYLAAIKALSGHFGIKYFVLFSPAFAAVIAVSSAVYFPPFYFLLALVAFMAKPKSLSKR
ncbi:hypothetical protein Q3O60_11965 [Alkalimonas collagenimarina]|uniref:Uncharacterized protein n=1 Tax=Alkalimonas collagenimarina TaxID=400390 RepID=A0ABT9H0S2_9GAMM|nr:hypothetical protein [Alkalimonas collagenimarina]MDP4536909.1 hypothetical protein [Alkalimonas collagenimarina]